MGASPPCGRDERPGARIMPGRFPNSYGLEEGSCDPSSARPARPTALTEMMSTCAPALSDVRSYSSRVGEAWRVLGPHALAHHRTELANDIEVLRRPLAAEETEA